MALELKFDQYFNINDHDQIMFWGSCFSENTSSRLSALGLNILSNSHGIIFNPISIKKAISDCITLKQITEDQLVKNDDIYSHFDFHGSFNALSPEEIVEDCNGSIIEFNKVIKANRKTKIFITFGSAWVYEYEGAIVANCHKIPSKQFNKRILSVQECLEAFNDIKTELSQVLNNFEIHFTVSPVRHKKDGWIENNLSKSTLLLAVNEFVSTNSNCHYFPVYEWVIDILRDYSYFAEDGVHPNEKAIDFVFKKFCRHYFDESMQEYVQKRKLVNSQLNHRIQLPGSNAHKKFLITLLTQIENLEKEYRFLQMNTEKQRIRRDLVKYFNHED